MKVLDKGHVEYMDHMGTDLTVVNAARVSFDKESDWEGEVFGTQEEAEEFGEVDKEHLYSDRWMGGYYSQRLSEKDTKLINYLARHNHWTPFGQCNLQLRIKMPIFVARQMMRSNIGIVWNEVSRRYVDSEPEFYIPETLRGRPDGNIKQGSGSDLDEVHGCQAGKELRAAHKESSSAYQLMLDLGVCPEQARMILPQSTYTEVVANFTLAALARVYSQRIDSHAQWEIQQYAAAMGEIAKELFPVSWEALTST